MRSQTVRMQATEHPGDGEPDALAEELDPGLLEMILQAGSREVTRPSVRRTVGRVDL